LSKFNSQKYHSPFNYNPKKVSQLIPPQPTTKQMVNDYRLTTSYVVQAVHQLPEKSHISPAHAQTLNYFFSLLTIISPFIKQVSAKMILTPY